MTRSGTTAGYSGRPLHAKLGMKDGMRCLAIGAPDDYAELLAGAPDVELALRRRAPPPRRRFDLVHLFVRREADLAQRHAAALEAVAEGGMLWISWPKKSAPAFVDLTEDGVRATVLETGWVDVKVCAVDGTWSALKFLRRRQPPRRR